MSSLTYLIENIETFIIDPLIILLFVLALLLFFFGLAKFILNTSGGNEEGKKEGKRHMFWGIIGIFIMVSVYGILKILTNTFGIPF